MAVLFFGNLIVDLYNRRNVARSSDWKGKMFQKSLLFCRGRTCCFLPEHPRFHVLPVRIVLGCKLPPSLVGVGEAASFRSQRHPQKQAQGWVAGYDQLRDDFEVMSGLLLGPKVRTGRKHI